LQACILPSLLWTQRWLGKGEVTYQRTPP